MKIHGFKYIYRRLKWSVSRSVLSDSVTPWTVARQAPLSMGFPRQEYWSGLPFPPPGDLPNSEIELGSPALWADSLPPEPPGKPIRKVKVTFFIPKIKKNALYMMTKGDITFRNTFNHKDWMEQYRKINKIRDICISLFIHSNYAWEHLLLFLFGFIVVDSRFLFLSFLLPSFFFVVVIIFIMIIST